MDKSNLPSTSGIPDYLLRQLNEFTQGGFVLVFVGNNGVADVIEHIDSPIIRTGIFKFAEDYFRASNREDAKLIEAEMGGFSETEDGEEPESLA